MAPRRNNQPPISVEWAESLIGLSMRVPDDWGRFWMDVRLKITFRLRCACYTCNYAYSAIPHVVRKILKKLLRIESHHHCKCV
jgi:hypothetical protein